MLSVCFRLSGVLLANLIAPRRKNIVVVNAQVSAPFTHLPNVVTLYRWCPVCLRPPDFVVKPNFLNPSGDDSELH